jgi:hypothetical protein
LILFEIIFDYLYAGLAACIGGCKINYFDNINLHSPIHSKLLYLTSQNGTSLCIYVHPSNQVEYMQVHLTRMMKLYVGGAVSRGLPDAGEEMQALLALEEFERPR